MQLKPGDAPVREPAVAGSFYPASDQGLRREVESHWEAVSEPRRALGVLAPHAGLVFSGGVAGAVYSQILRPDTAILVGPDHRGLGGPLTFMGEGVWRVPGGEVSIDAPLARDLLARLPQAVDDPSPHGPEHCLEVQIPFLWYAGREEGKKLRIVPVLMRDFSLDSCLRLGDALAQALKDREDLWTIVASSDLNHYESQAVTEQKDRAAIEAILQMDPQGLIETVLREKVTMCGYGPMAATLAACRALGAKGAELVRHATSGDVNGDYERVVGYAGIVIR